MSINPGYDLDNLDNEGSGFDLGDDDFDDIFNAANQAAEDDENTSRFFDADYVADEYNEPVTPEPQVQYVEPEVTPEPEIEPEIIQVEEEQSWDTEFTVDDIDSILSEETIDEPEPVLESVVEDIIVETVTEAVHIDDENVAEIIEDISEPDHEIEPEPIFNEPVPVEVKQEVTDPVRNPSRIHIPTEQDQLVNVSRIIRVLDTYRDLTPDEKMVSGQFLANGEEIHDEGLYVVKALNSDVILRKSMIALVEAKEKEAVESAFYIVELEDKVLAGLGQLVSVFTSKDIEAPLSNRTRYAYDVVKNILALDAKSMSFAIATARILKAAAEN